MAGLKKLVKKGKTAAKKTSLSGGKAMVTGGKLGVGVGKAMNMYSPGSGDKVIAGGRAAKASGRLSRETARGNTVGNRKRIAKIGATVNALRFG